MRAPRSPLAARRPAGGTRGLVAALEGRERQEVDQVLELGDRVGAQRQQARARVEQRVLLHAEDGAQCIGDVAVLPLVTLGDRDRLAAHRAQGPVTFLVGGKDQHAVDEGLDRGGIEIGGAASARRRRGVAPEAVEQRLLQCDLGEARLLGERRAVHEVLEPARGGVALGIALVLEPSDQVDDRDARVAGVELRRFGRGRRRRGGRSRRRLRGGDGHGREDAGENQDDSSRAHRSSSSRARESATRPSPRRSRA